MSKETTAVRYDEVCRRTGLCRTTIWRKVRDGEFPRPFTLSGRIKAWTESDLENWFEARREASQ